MQKRFAEIPIRSFFTAPGENDLTLLFFKDVEEKACLVSYFRAHEVSVLFDRPQEFPVAPSLRSMMLF